MPLLGATSGRASPPTTRGQSRDRPGWFQAALAWLRGGSGEGAAAAWAPGVGAQGRGPRWGLVILQPTQERVRKRGHECASEDECGCNLGEVCAHLGVSYPEEERPSPLTPSHEVGEAHIGLGSQWGSPAATQGKLLPQAVGPSTAQKVPSLAGLAVGLISGVQLGGPRTLAQVGWRMGWGGPLGSSN